MNLSDERGILVSWLVKLLLGLAIAGLLLFEVGAIAVNTFTLSSSANDIAIAALALGPSSGVAPRTSPSWNPARYSKRAAHGSSRRGATADRIVRFTSGGGRTLLVQRFAQSPDGPARRSAIGLSISYYLRAH